MVELYSKTQFISILIAKNNKNSVNNFESSNTAKENLIKRNYTHRVSMIWEKMCDGKINNSFNNSSYNDSFNSKISRMINR